MKVKKVLSLNQNTVYIFFLSLIFIGAILVRISCVDFNRAIANGDESAYDYAAKDIIKYHQFIMDREGKVYLGEEEPQPTCGLQVGYPIVVAIIYWLFGEGNTYSVFAFQCMLSVLDLFIMLFIMRIISVNKYVQILILLMAALYPGFIVNNNRMLTEQLFKTLLLCSSLFYIYSISHECKIGLGISSILVSFATYVRGVAFPFIILECLLLLIYGVKDKVKKLCYICGPFVVTQLIWWIRNWINFKKIILLTTAGEGPKIWGAMPYFLDMSSSENKTLDMLINDNLAIDAFSYIKWRIFGFLNYMWADIWDETLTHSGYRYMLWIHLVVILTLVLLPLIIKKNGNIISAYIVAFPYAFTIMNMPYHGLPRYVYPSIPYIFIALGMMLSNFRDLSKGKECDNSNNSIHLISQIFNKLYVVGGIVFSIALFYSVFIFGNRINLECSTWRLKKYSDISITDLEECSSVKKSIFYKEDVIFNNCVYTDGKYINTDDGSCIINLDCEKANVDNVVTKVEMEMKGGYLFDYQVVYWKSGDMEEYSENKCYKYPINSLKSKNTIYIDGDVESLMIVPIVFKNGSFEYNNIKIEKIQI